jgi:hypothetical protein
MGAVLTLTGGQCPAANPRTVTFTIAGGTGSGLAITGNGDFQINAAGLRFEIKAWAIVGTTLTLTLGFAIWGGWTGCTFVAAAGTTITDSGGNTLQGQSGSFANNSTATGQAYAANAAGVHIYGIFNGAQAAGGAGIAFSARGTDIAVIGIPGNSATATIDLDGVVSTSNNTPYDFAWFAMTAGTGMSDVFHEVKFTLDLGYLDFGGSSGWSGSATILVTGSAPALREPDGGTWGERYFFDSGPFTDVVSGSNTKGRIYRLTADSTAVGGKTAYRLDAGNCFRFSSNSPTVAIFGYANGVKYDLYQDGKVAPEGGATMPAGNTLRRLLIGSGLDTSVVHTYEIFLDTFLNAGLAYSLYVELQGGGIANVAQPPPFIEFEYGDSRTAQYPSFLTNVSSSAQFISARRAGHWAAWHGLGGASVTTYFRDNTNQIPFAAMNAGGGRLWLPPGINDVGGGNTGATLQGDYQTMLTTIRASWAGEIICEQPWPTNGGYTGRGAFGVSMQAAIAAMSDPDIIYVPTNNWVTPDSAHMPDTLHYSNLGYEELGNRTTKIAMATAITLTPPATHATGSASGNGTFTLNGGATFCGDEPFTLTSDNVSDVITPSVGSPGTGAVTITPTNGLTGGTFTVLRTTAGTSTITVTTTLAGWTMPSAVSYVATGGGGGGDDGPASIGRFRIFTPDDLMIGSMIATRNRGFGQ